MTETGQPTTPDLEIIHIIWEGPFDVETAGDVNCGGDYGIYPITVSTLNQYINTNQPDFRVIGQAGHGP